MALGPPRLRLPASPLLAPPAPPAVLALCASLWLRAQGGSQHDGMWDWALLECEARCAVWEYLLRMLSALHMPNGMG